jgi:hypothetical protein
MGLKLDRVTLCCIDTAQPAAALRAMHLCQKQVQFAESIFVTSEEFADRESESYSAIEFIGIPPMNSGQDYSRLMMRELAGIIQTSHVLVVQWDGYVLNGARWSEEFLEFDYIGSVWAEKKAGRSVGNGGFSLRSKRLLDLLALPTTPSYHPEDVATSVELRPMLETKGIKFADEGVASRFSFEQVQPESVEGTFGFHGAFNLWRVVPNDEIGALLDSIAPYNFSTPPIVHLMKQYAANRQWGEALAVLQRIEKANPPQKVLEILAILTAGDIERAKGVVADIHAKGRGRA